MAKQSVEKAIHVGVGIGAQSRIMSTTALTRRSSNLVPSCLPVMTSEPHPRSPHAQSARPASNRSSSGRPWPTYSRFRGSIVMKPWRRYNLAAAISAGSSGPRNHCGAHTSQMPHATDDTSSSKRVREAARHESVDAYSFICCCSTRLAAVTARTRSVGYFQGLNVRSYVCPRNRGMRDAFDRELLENRLEGRMPHVDVRLDATPASPRIRARTTPRGCRPRTSSPTATTS